MKTGRVEWVRFVSEVLEGNAAGDPHARRVPVYLPPSYDERPERRYPVAYLLHGIPGQEWRSFHDQQPYEAGGRAGNSFLSTSP